MGGRADVASPAEWRPGPAESECLLLCDRALGGATPPPSVEDATRLLIRSSRHPWVQFRRPFLELLLVAMDAESESLHVRQEDASPLLNGLLDSVSRDPVDRDESDMAKLALEELYRLDARLRPTLLEIVGSSLLAWSGVAGEKSGEGGLPPHPCGDGVSTLLLLLLKVFRGFGTPLKRRNLRLFRRLLVPLHRSPHLSTFFAELLPCVVELLRKEPNLLVPTFVAHIVWPGRGPSQTQILVLGEVFAVFECVVAPGLRRFLVAEETKTAHGGGRRRSGTGDGAGPSSGAWVPTDRQEGTRVVGALFEVLGRGVASDHLGVAERACRMLNASLFGNEHHRRGRRVSLSPALEVFPAAVLRAVVPSLNQAAGFHWSEDIAVKADGILAELIDVDGEGVEIEVNRAREHERRQVRQQQERAKAWEAILSASSPPKKAAVCARRCDTKEGKHVDTIDVDLDIFGRGANRGKAVVPRDGDPGGAMSSPAREKQSADLSDIECVVHSPPPRYGNRGRGRNGYRPSSLLDLPGILPTGDESWPTLRSFDCLLDNSKLMGAVGGSVRHEGAYNRK